MYESEDGDSARRLRFVGYWWGDPMCWLDPDTIAIGGIGTDDQAMIDGVEIYHASTGRRLCRIAGPTGPLHCDGQRLYASAPHGLGPTTPSPRSTAPTSCSGARADTNLNRLARASPTWQAREVIEAGRLPHTVDELRAARRGERLKFLFFWDTTSSGDTTPSEIVSTKR